MLGTQRNYRFATANDTTFRRIQVPLFDICRHRAEDVWRALTDPDLLFRPPMAWVPLYIGFLARISGAFDVADITAVEARTVIDWPRVSRDPRLAGRDWVGQYREGCIGQGPCCSVLFCDCPASLDACNQVCLLGLVRASVIAIGAERASVAVAQDQLPWVAPQISRPISWAKPGASARARRVMRSMGATAGRRV